MMARSALPPQSFGRFELTAWMQSWTKASFQIAVDASTQR
jgi:hypothetical protein